MRVAIMQPTYLPWSGYFGLMRSVDLFILLDSVQFARRSWQQRNQIKTANGPIWLTVPVLSKGKRDQTIADVEIDPTRDFPESHLRAVELSYTKAPHFPDYRDQFADLLRGEHRRLVDCTVGVILWIRERLGITTPLRRSSEFSVSGAKSELLVSLCEAVGATEYVSPPGSKDYLDQTDIFVHRGLPLRYFHFAHPEYPQRFGAFVPYMSVVDLLFNCGPDSLAVIERGCTVAS